MFIRGVERGEERKGGRRDERREGGRRGEEVVRDFIWGVVEPSPAEGV